MFSTSLSAAVVGLMAVGSLPNLQTDYRKALTISASEQKPVAVFIARGSDGYAKLVSEGTLGSEATDALKQKYVPIYVNTATDTGVALARSFGMSEGLVISNRTGSVQALRHEGTVSQTELSGYLKRFTETSWVATTEQHAAGQVGIAAAPVAVAAPVYAPAPAVTPASYFQPARSSCPNGRCPYAR